MACDRPRNDNVTSHSEIADGILIVKWVRLQ
jgi:hypothetical protein